MLTEFQRDEETCSEQNAACGSGTADNIGPIYASRFMENPVPKYRIPEDEMPAAVASRIIRDEMELDGIPGLNLATFVNTYIEPEAEELAAMQLTKNAIDVDEYPRTAEIQSRCVQILGDLFNTPMGEKACGVPTLGSSEGCLLGGLAMKLNWRKERRSKGLPASRPNIVIANSAQVVWKKFLLTCDVEPHWVPLTLTSYVIDVDEAIKQVDENTIGVVMLFASTLTGEYENVAAMNAALERLNAEKGWNVGIHIDAASGGFVAPFVQQHITWDFKLPLVRSINVSSHKFGLVQPGIGFIIWRLRSLLPEEMIFHINYLGGDEMSVGLNFSRSASGAINQYYNFLRLGRKAYTAVIQELMNLKKFIAKAVSEMDNLEVVGTEEGVPLVAFHIKNTDDIDFTEFDISKRLKEHSWLVPAYTLPANAESISILRVVIREGMSFDLCTRFVADLKQVIDELQTKARAQPHASNQHPRC